MCKHRTNFDAATSKMRRRQKKAETIRKLQRSTLDLNICLIADATALHVLHDVGYESSSSEKSTPQKKVSKIQ